MIPHEERKSLGISATSNGPACRLAGGRKSVRIFNENSKGPGHLDLALAVQGGGAPRASGALSNHVLDVILTILEAPPKGGFVDIRGRCERLIPLAKKLSKERK